LYGTLVDPPAGRSQIRLVRFNPFDISGAGSGGMPAVWVNRSAAIFDAIGWRPGLTVAGLDELSAALAG
jgi:hypothetical protein